MFKLLDKLTDEWQISWIITWFICGILALLWGLMDSIGVFSGQSLSRNATLFEAFKLLVAIIGMVCVVALAFRKNRAGNGLGALANSGEIIAQGGSGNTSLMLAPTTGAYGSAQTTSGLR